MALSQGTVEMGTYHGENTGICKHPFETFEQLKSHTTKGINNKLGVGHAKTNDTNAVQLVMFFRGFKRNLGKQ